MAMPNTNISYIAIVALMAGGWWMYRAHSRNRTNLPSYSLSFKALFNRFSTFLFWRSIFGIIGIRETTFLHTPSHLKPSFMFSILEINILPTGGTEKCNHIREVVSCHVIEPITGTKQLSNSGTKQWNQIVEILEPNSYELKQLSQIVSKFSRQEQIVEQLGGIG